MHANTATYLVVMVMLAWRELIVGVLSWCWPLRLVRGFCRRRGTGVQMPEGVAFFAYAFPVGGEDEEEEAGEERNRQRQEG